MKRPSFQFYPGDWLRDMGLRGCSMEAQGLWANMLCLMHDGSPYGHLAIDGVPWTDEQAAKATGLQVREYRRLLGELERGKVFSRDAAGAIYSRRMVKDELIRQTRANSGSKGGSKTQANRQANGVATRQQMVASADADADGSSEKGSGEKPTGPVFAGLVRRLAGHPGRFAILELLTHHLPENRDPDAWAGQMNGCLDGTLLAGNRPVSIEELAAACLEYPGIPDVGWNPAHFISAVERTAKRLRRGAGPDLPSKNQASEDAWLASRR